MDQVCFNAPETIGAIVTSVVTVASVVANLVSTDSFIGKVIHYLALNIKKQ